MLETTLENKKPTNSRIMPSKGNAMVHLVALASVPIEFK